MSGSSRPTGSTAARIRDQRQLARILAGMTDENLIARIFSAAGTSGRELARLRKAAEIVTADRVTLLDLPDQEAR